LEQLKYFGTKVTHQNSIQEEIKRRMKSGNPYYISEQNLLSSSLLTKHIKINPLKPTGLLVTWRTTSLTVNNCTFCPHCIYVFCIYLRTNSDLCHLQYKLIGFYNPDEKCLLRGTDWVFK